MGAIDEVGLLMAVVVLYMSTIFLILIRGALASPKIQSRAHLYNLKYKWQLKPNDHARGSS